jgi:hypothetical protein
MEKLNEGPFDALQILIFINRSFEPSLQKTLSISI